MVRANISTMTWVVLSCDRSDRSGTAWVAGVKMEIYDEPEPANTYGGFICANCDTPAARKISGTAGHSHDHHPCPYCKINILAVNKLEGFDRSMILGVLCLCIC